jgi:hypothetical protein
MVFTLTGAKLTTANSFTTRDGSPSPLRESSVLSQIRAERTQRGAPMVTVVRSDLTAPGDTWAVSVFKRSKDGYEVRAFSPATGRELSHVLSFRDIAAAAALSSAASAPSRHAHSISPAATRCLHDGAPVPPPAVAVPPTPFALPRRNKDKWVRDTLPYSVEVYHRPGASGPSLRLRESFFSGLDRQRGREKEEFARRDAKTKLGKPPQSTSGLPPRGAEPRACY